MRVLVSYYASLVVAVSLSVSLSVSATSQSQSQNSLFQQFQSWKSRNSKRYESIADEQRAFEAWTANALRLAPHLTHTQTQRDSDSTSASETERESRRWTASLNQFADLTQEEFATRFLMRPQTTSLSKAQALNSSVLVPNKSKSLPQSFDWRTDSAVPVVTAVRDQGSVGSCWAFSAVENIEGQWALAGNSLIELSPEFLVDCDGTSDGVHADCSVFGGWPYLAYQYIIGAGGVPSEQQWPYCSGTGDCYPCMQGPTKLCGPPPYYCDETIAPKCKSFTPAAKISSWSSLPTNEDDIASLLMTQGPLSVLLDATQLQFYQSGVWDGHISGSNPRLGCTKTGLNHAVLLVGFGSEDGTPYWIVKNSWGQKWGEQGYFRISRGSGTCGINTAVTTSIA